MFLKGELLFGLLLAARVVEVIADRGEAAHPRLPG
jgi:hypothetical protein